MCFVNEGDWTATVYNIEDRVATERVRCEECRSWIHPGESFEHHYACEYEDYEWCDPETERHSEDCDSEDKSHFDDCWRTSCESFSASICERCVKLRSGISKLEVLEGCGIEESVPFVGGLFENVDCGEGWEHYHELALQHGMNDVAALMPMHCDIKHIVDDLAYDGQSFGLYKRHPRGVYANAVCEKLGINRPPEWFELGGEG